MASGSKKAVYAALFGNLGIAITKFIAALITGSAAMWAEAYHSSSDTFNQILILFGIRTSVKAASYQHQFGHGREVFFWSFIVATMLFGISGILSLQQGVSSLFEEFHEVKDSQIS
ncbi:MAG: cation diffusion facilitator family transporter, partial [Candidatus Nitrosotenuis sp.]